MTTEFEVKYRLSYIEKDEIVKKILGMGFQEKGKVQIVDEYFYNPSLLEKPRMRIRNMINQNIHSTEYFITFKEPNVGNMINQRTEFETSISFAASRVLTTILESLGMKKLGTVKKTREMYQGEYYKVFFDWINGIEGVFMEIEVGGYQMDETDVENKLVNFSEFLIGYKKENIRISYIDMVVENYK